MDELSNEDLATYVRVREFLRYSRGLPQELTESDVLVKSGDANATFGEYASWQTYVSGYFQVARALIEGPRDRFMLTFAIYPVLFLYRHYIELALKGSMMDVARLLNVSCPDFKSDHDLLSLWSKLKKLVPQDQASLLNFPDIARILHEMYLIDPKSMDTRYALQKDLRTVSLQKQFDIDIDNLREIMDRLQFELEVIPIVVEAKTKDERRRSK